MFADALILTGPTACGKTALAVAVAPRLGAEVVAMDSMTVYRGMDVGTAKPTAAERAPRPAPPDRRTRPVGVGTVAWWLDRAADACARHRRARQAAALRRRHAVLPEGPPARPVRRPARRRGTAHRLEAEAERVGNGGAARAAGGGRSRRPRRGSTPTTCGGWSGRWRSIELTGKPISALAADVGHGRVRRRRGPAAAAIPAVVLELPRDVLYDRINRRVGAMLAAGWLDEVQPARDARR